MKISILLLGVFAAVIWVDRPAKAQDYPWCAYYNYLHGGATNCGFVTHQQCLATIRGVGGSCGPNPRYQGPPLRRRQPRYPY
jgi:hypothetical protein